MVVRAIHISTLSVIPLGIQYEIVDGFTAMGRVRYSFALSFFRKFVYFTALFLLPRFFDSEDSETAGIGGTADAHKKSIKNLISKKLFFSAEFSKLSPEKNSFFCFC